MQRNTPTRTPSSSSSRGRGNTPVDGARQSDPNYLFVVPSVSLEHMAVGNICWLTEKVQIREEILCVSNHECEEVYLRDDAFKHPIVITALRQRPGSFIPGDVMAQFCVISSYRNERVEEYITAKLKIRKFFFLIPIRQGPERPWQGVFREAFPKAGVSPVKQDDSDSKLARSTFQLDLSSESQLLQSQSFIDPEHVWEMPVKDIKPYRFKGQHKAAYSFRLSKDSYFVLAAKCGVEPQPYDPTWLVRSRGYNNALQLYTPLWEPLTYRPDGRYVVDSILQYQTNQMSWRGEWSSNVGNGATPENKRQANQIAQASGQEGDYFTQPILSQNETVASQRRLLLDIDNPTPALETPFLRRLNPAALSFSPRPSPNASTLAHIPIPTSLPRRPDFSSPLAIRPTIQAPTLPTPPFVAPVRYPSAHAPTFIPASFLATPILTTTMPQSTLPNYQTSTATEEPVIPITPYLLRNNIGQVREFIYASGQRYFTIDLLPLLVDEDHKLEAVCPEEFEEDEEEEKE